MGLLACVVLPSNVTTRGRGQYRLQRDADHTLTECILIAGAAEPCCWLQCLEYMLLMLQDLSSQRHAQNHTGAAMSFADLWESILLVGIRHDSPLVRYV